MDALAKEVDDSLSATAPAFTTAGDTDDTLDEAVQDAALELKDGEVADKVIEGDDGYYVVRLDKMRQKIKRRRLFQKENLICLTAHWKTG